MRSLFVFVTLLFSLPTFADYCTSYLKDGQATIRSFQGFGYNGFEACNQAMRDCNYEKSRIRNHRSYRNLYCTTAFNQQPAKARCTFEVVVDGRRRSRVISQHSAQGNNMRRACVKAQNKCFNALSRAPFGARCVKKLGRGGDRPNYVTRTCTAQKIGRRGATRNFYGTATGPRGTGIKRQACNKALRQCQMSGRGNGRCQVIGM